MLEKNDLDRILPISVRTVNAETEYWYEITGLCSLEAISDKAERRPWEIRQMMGCVQAVYQTLERYLLDLSHVSLDVRHVFVDENGVLLFCYGPERVPGYERQTAEFLWFLLGSMDHSDALGEAELYRLYRSLLKETESPLEVLSRAKESKGEAEFAPEAQTAVPQIQNVPIQSDTCESDREKGSGNLLRRVGELFTKQKMQKREKGIPPETAISSEAAQSHCFLRSCGEMILETSELNCSPFLIGSSRSDCNLWLIAPAVSRVHAKLLYERGRWYLTDAGSVNGTKWNQIPVRKGEKRELQPGDQLDFAGIIYVFDRIEHPGGIRLDNPYRSG